MLKSPRRFEHALSEVEGDAVIFGEHILNWELDIGERRTETSEALHLIVARQCRGGEGDMPPVTRCEEVVQGRDVPFVPSSSTYRRRSALFTSADMGTSSLLRDHSTGGNALPWRSAPAV